MEHKPQAGEKVTKVLDQDLWLAQTLHVSNCHPLRLQEGDGTRATRKATRKATWCAYPLNDNTFAPSQEPDGHVPNAYPAVTTFRQGQRLRKGL